VVGSPVDFETTIIQLKKENAGLVSLVNGLRKDIDGKNIEVIEGQDGNALLRDQNQYLQRDIDQLQRDNAQLQRDNAQLQRDNATLTARVNVHDDRLRAVEILLTEFARLFAAQPAAPRQS
jgi:septal ring factor EnvC (AmiA/AmiB activator)